MPLWIAIFWLPAALGHAALCIAVVNRTHAVGWPQGVVRVATLGLGLCVLAAPLAWLAWALSPAGPSEAWPVPSWQTASVALRAALAYAAICWGLGVVVLPWRMWSHATLRRCRLLLTNHTERLDLAASLPPAARHGGIGRLVLGLPGNEALRLDENEKTVVLPRLAPGLDGLSIVHLSDLHYSGRVAVEYFEAVVDRANQLDADLIAITGDIVDVAACVAWIPRTLGRLRARHGIYYILGNHDRRVDVTRLRALLNDAGFVDVGGRWQRVDVGGESLLLAGNELPWFGPAADPRDCPAPDDPAALRVLLSHSPDQFAWARRHRFDLMLAGHTHGGQVAIPGLGAVLAPSLHGAKYASGTFYRPPTLMHVTRGLSSLMPLRWRCPPELVKLCLRCPAEPDRRTAAAWQDQTTA